MSAFIGRRDELEELESLYVMPGLKTYALYGRKDLGKTALLKEFCEGKAAFTSTSETATRSRMRHTWRMS